MQEHKNTVIFGVRIDLLRMDEALSYIKSVICTRTPTQHMAVNVAKLVSAQSDHKLMEIINSCGIVTADGQGIVWAAGIQGHYIAERITGIDLMNNVIKMASEMNYRIYLLGAREDIIRKVRQVLKYQYPTLKMAGYKNGYFSNDEEAGIAEEIKKTHADILFVAMPSPKKELFLNKYLNFMQVPFVMGVGGSFDVVAGLVKRAPLWMQRSGLEWFYRLLSEPRRLWKRYLTTNAIFFWMVLRSLFKHK